MVGLVSIIESTKNSLYIFGTAGRYEEVQAGMVGLGQSLNKINCKVFVESEDNLFTKSLISDTEVADNRVSFSKLTFDQRRVLDNLPRKLADQGIEVKICYLDLPTNFVISDERIFVSDWIISPVDNYSEINPDTQRGRSIKLFAEYLLDNNKGGKYCASYRNQKGDLTETIELYDENRVRRGIFPRSSFYDSDFVKLVVWVLQVIVAFVDLGFQVHPVQQACGQVGNAASENPDAAGNVLNSAQHPKQDFTAATKAERDGQT